MDWMLHGPLFALLGLTVLAVILAAVVLAKLSAQSADRRDARDALLRLEAQLEAQARGFGELREELHRRGREAADLQRAFAEQQQAAAEALRETTRRALEEHRVGFEQRQGETREALGKSLSDGQQRVAASVVEALTRHAEEISKRLEKLTGQTDERLKEISGQVDKRLAEGFEKTTETFGDVLKRLALIDKAQEEITKLSTNVVSLQHVLSDKKSRGAFGEVQLEALVRNALPPDAYAFQATLSNGTRADCLLKLPKPTGCVAIDSKFPLEAYQAMTNQDRPEAERTAAGRQFKADIKKHIADIAGRYIVEGETGDGAVMFLPAESVFAEIHAHHRDLVEEAMRARVWITSPTTMMAILTTARAVLKDEATRRQVHIIKEHLVRLGQDFNRFQDRIEKLAVNVERAHKEAGLVATSAGKLTSRFRKIEKADLSALEEDAPEALPERPPAAEEAPPTNGHGDKELPLG
ncbi:MAG: DNA recombination protein RmuC [Verrucomicrobiota bacterium]